MVITVSRTATTAHRSPIRARSPLEKSISARLWPRTRRSRRKRLFVIPESVQKASSHQWARVKDGILAGKRKAQASSGRIKWDQEGAFRDEYMYYPYRSRVVDVYSIYDALPPRGADRRVL